MKFKDKDYMFTTDKITDIWVALNSQIGLTNNKEINVGVREHKKPVNKCFPARNKITCALERIEDGLEYLNSFELIPDSSQKNAFEFIAFLNCEYVIVHCIHDLAKIFGVNISSITDVRDCFSDFNYGNGNDNDVFEYVRSLCAVHPTDTSRHTTVHKEGEFDCCSRVVWDSISSTAPRDLTAVVYASQDDGDAQYIGIKIEPFVLYLNKWIDILKDIERKIYIYIEEEKERFKKKPILLPKDFESYLKYIDNLHKEYEHRVGDPSGYLNYFEYYKLAFQIHFDNAETEKKKECYKAAIKYMFRYLHDQMQEMDDKKYSGIKDLPDNYNTNLFYELYLPIEGKSKFSNERSAFTYVNNLDSNYQYDVHHAREVLDVIKPLVNEYVEFSNTEPKDETHLLLQIATYFDALKQDGYINRRIPNTNEYRGNFNQEI